MVTLPGGPLATRPLHFFWIVDCSGSMEVDGKIQALNTAVREALPQMRQAAEQNPNAQVLVRVLRFASDAQWQSDQPIPLEDFHWQDLLAEGVTNLGQALRLLAEELKSPPMPERALPPVLVLISDGQATDDFKGGLEALLAEGWGERAVRIAVAIGDDVDREMLQRFIANPNQNPLDVHSPEALVQLIKWASTVPLKAASNPVARPISPSAPEGPSVPIPGPVAADSGPSVW